MAVKPNRKHSVIDRLPQDMRDTVEMMLMTGAIYTDVVQYLAQHGVSLSVSAVCRYAQGYLAGLEQTRIARENLGRMMEEINKYPNLDTTKAIELLTSHNLLNTLSQMPQEKWQELDAKEATKQATALIRAAAYKSRVDLQNKSDLDAAWDVVHEVIFNTMALDQPELYKQVMDYAQQRKAAAGDGQAGT